MTKKVLNLGGALFFGAISLCFAGDDMQEMEMEVTSSRCKRSFQDAFHQRDGRQELENPFKIQKKEEMVVGWGYLRRDQLQEEQETIPFTDTLTSFYDGAPFEQERKDPVDLLQLFDRQEKERELIEEFSPYPPTRPNTPTSHSSMHCLTPMLPFVQTKNMMLYGENFLGINRMGCFLPPQW